MLSLETEFYQNIWIIRKSLHKMSYTGYKPFDYLSRIHTNILNILCVITFSGSLIILACRLFLLSTVLHYTATLFLSAFDRFPWDSCRITVHGTYFRRFLREHIALLHVTSPQRVRRNQNSFLIPLPFYLVCKVIWGWKLKNHLAYHYYYSKNHSRKHKSKK